MEIQIPEEIRNMLIPEFLMGELSNLEHCEKGCAHCGEGRGSGGRLSDACLYLQLSKAQARISDIVPQVFKFLNAQRLARRKGATGQRPMPDSLYEAFPTLTVPQCNELSSAWALYEAKYESPAGKDAYVVRFRYHAGHQMDGVTVPAHILERWDRDTLTWVRQGVYLFSNTYREVDEGENLKERSRFLSDLLSYMRHGYQIQYVPGIFPDVASDQE